MEVSKRVSEFVSVCFFMSERTSEGVGEATAANFHSCCVRGALIVNCASCVELAVSCAVVFFVSAVSFGLRLDRC